MTSGQDVSEILDILGLVKSYFSSFFGHEKKIKKIENFFFVVLRTPQRIKRFACLQDCLLTLTCHLARIQKHEVSIDTGRGLVSVLMLSKHGKGSVGEGEVGKRPRRPRMRVGNL
jgi:hypothetical protein